MVAGRRWHGGPGGICLAAALAVSAGASAEPPEPANAFTACHQRAARKEVLLDRASRRLHQTVCGAALWFDGLFGERDLAAALQSYGRIELATAHSEHTGTRVRVRFDVRTPLPAMHERLSFFAGVDDANDYARDRSEGEALRSRRSETDHDQFLAGLGFAGLTTVTFRSDFRVGVRSWRMPKAFVQNRFTYVPYSQARDRVVLRLTPFWNNRDRSGVTGSTTLDHVAGESFLVRWDTVATITEVSRGLDWRTAVVYYQNLHGSHALAYEAFIRGGSAAPEPLGDYGLRIVYRAPLSEGRLFGQLVLGYSWPRDDPALQRDGAADAGLGVELPFGLPAA